jgi:hypothetical protein
MRKAALLVVIFLALLLAPLAVRYFQYYRPLTSAPATPPAYSAASIAAVPTPAAGDFNDEPDVSRVANNSAGGLVVLDQAHGNQFTREELAALDGLLAARGLELRPLTEDGLGDALRPAVALVVIAPVRGYTTAEAQAVVDFVGRGGRVLLVGDPTRYNVEFDETDIFAAPIIETAQVPLNDLANAFGITFRGDYLYNTVANEGNFRNILLTGEELADQPLTDGLEQLVLYSSHSLQLGPAAAPLLSADDDTWSSATDRPGGLALAALSPAESDAGQLLAIGDVHFLLEPYNTVYDNGAFAARVADFLTGGAADGGLARFPYFYESPVDLVFSDDPELGPDAFDEIIALQGAFRALGLSLALVDEPAADHDTLTLGLYNRADDVADLMAAAGVELSITPNIPAAADATTPANATRLITSALGEVEMAGTALILLSDDGERRQVVVLAASNDGLESAVNRLLGAAESGGVDLSGCLLQDDLALCPTNVNDEPVEYELVTSGPADLTPATDDDDDRPDNGQAPTGEPADQGAIELGETKSEELVANEAHAWTFSDGPATIDITVDADTDLDAVVELYAPDDTLLANTDSAFAGGVEEMRGIAIPDDGDYRIVIRDFFNDGGGYELAVTAGEPGQDEAATPGNRIFLFIDDDGEPLAGGFTSAALMAAELSGEYEVTSWSAADDGPLPADALQGIDVFIWESGDYRAAEAPPAEELSAILAYVDAGGDLLISGLSPAILGEIETAPLGAARVVANDPLLSEGFSDGQPLDFDQTYPVAVPADDDTGADDYLFLMRGATAAEAGAAVGGGEVAANDQRTIFLLAPLAGLAEEDGARLFNNIMAWLRS